MLCSTRLVKLAAIKHGNSQEGATSDGTMTMSNKEYTLLAQRTEEEEQEQSHVPLEADGVCIPSTKGFTSPWFIGIALVAFLAINGLCLMIMTNRLRAVSMALEPLLDFTDTRHLPRPDQYDGL
ncbi:uncharacterized protein BJ212DRAFT_1296467 [Suillus subaureus]|uniref:Uncharacterized protein n=1 Tax=Suillus subaureus TaxID=48587 RepID=A0A9P7JIJ7_9AGAM|nr:uncharacterized protein BJ212DRAFT_1296467 [Suillus subaureus]KAG1823951.1 hypothetical protein BJ212DRAFT_1296467 [Suillus subaureus]